MRSALLLLFTAAVVHAAVPADENEDVRRLLRAGKLNEAETAATSRVAAAPRDPEAHALLGSVCMARGNPEAAVQAFEKATELAPANSEYQRQLGDAYGLTAQRAGLLWKMGWGRKCRLAYEKAVELDPANLAARTCLMTFYQQAPAIAGGGMEKAYAQAAAIKKVDPNRGRIAYVLLYTGERKFTEAFKELEEALQQTPDHYLARFHFGRTAALSGQHVERGMDALRKCLTMPVPTGSPGHDAVHAWLGRLWERKGNRDAARAAYQSSLAINPGSSEAIDALKKLD